MIKSRVPVKELNYGKGGWVCLGGRHPIKSSLPYMDEMKVFVCLEKKCMLNITGSQNHHICFWIK